MGRFEKAIFSQDLQDFAGLNPGLRIGFRWRQRAYVARGDLTRPQSQSSVLGGDERFDGVDDGHHLNFGARFSTNAS